MDPWIYPSIHPSINPFIHGSMDLSIHSSMDPWICPSIHPWIHPSIHPFMEPWTHPSIIWSLSLLSSVWSHCTHDFVLFFFTVAVSSSGELARRQVVSYHELL
jgi:hypothetical protein